MAAHGTQYTARFFRNKFEMPNATRYTYIHRAGISVINVRLKATEGA